jgi:hypothetical protein
MFGKEINQIQNDRKVDDRTGVSTFAIRTSQRTNQSLKKVLPPFQRREEY